MRRYLVFSFLIVTSMCVNSQEISERAVEVESILTYYENGKFELAVKKFEALEHPRLIGHKLSIAMRDSYLELSKTDLANKEAYLKTSQSFQDEGIKNYGESLMENGYDTDVYTLLDEPAIFPGGHDAFKKYLKSETNYPKSAIVEKAEGRVFVQYIINPEGELEALNVVKSVHPDLDKEAIRVLREGPNWVPGKQEGEPVYVMMIQNIGFRLKDIN